MTDINVNRAVEALIFASGEPAPIDRICSTLEITADEVEAAVLAINAERADSAVYIVKLGDCYQMTTRAEHAAAIRRFLDITRNAPLSSAAFEVLAVVAYNQPVTRAFIEQVRGVDCSGVMSTLMEKGLIEERGRLELPGRPLLYGTTKNFLRCFSMSDLAELPPLPEKEDGSVQLQLPEEEGAEMAEVSAELAE